MTKRSFLLLLSALLVQLCIGVLSFVTYNGQQGFLFPLLIRIFVLFPLLIPAAAAFRDTRSAYSGCILAALCLSAAGDSCITLGAAIGGAVCFFFVHALNAGNFVSLFYRQGGSLGWKEVLSGLVFFTAGFFVYSGFFYRNLLSDRPMLVLVLVYAVVLSYALWKAFLLYSAGGATFWLAVFSGELLFYFTDIQVAYSELVLHHPTNEWVNNMIYYTGLFLLSVSALLEKEELLSPSAGQ